MATKSNKGRPKPPKGRPTSTSVISHPVVEDTTQLTSLSAFSPNATHFAFVSLAVDKHRLRVYDTVSGQSVTEYVVDFARVSALTWAAFDPFDGQSAAAEASPTKKKRKKRTGSAPEELQGNKAIDVVILGLTDGSILLFSPSHGRVLRTLSDPSSTAEILSVILVQNGNTHPILWAAGSDGTVRLWNVQKNEIVGSWKNDDRIPYTSMAMRPTADDERIDVLVARHNIRLLSLPLTNIGLETKKPAEIASFTGHASPIKDLKWDASTKPSTRFLSRAEGDRFLYIWETPDGASLEGKPVASVPLESDVRNFSLFVTQKYTGSGSTQTLLTVSASGKISLFPIPFELSPPASTNRTPHRIPTLHSRSNISVSTDKSPTLSGRVIDASFLAGEEGSIRIARLVGGVRLIFDSVRYLNPAGEFLADVRLDDVTATSLEAASSTGPSLQRYAENPSLAIASGVQLAQDEAMEALVERDVEGELDVDLAELSLGQRLTALSGEVRPIFESDDESPKKQTRQSKKKDQSVPANSLTRTLIQALHSSDSRLLEMCLVHTDQNLIRNTVKRLPPQLAVPLLVACTERLGRGARAANMKGGGGGASSQRGMGLISWIKATLVVHSGHLMTEQIPDLVARLSGLHATLTSRLSLQESLLSLSGRLDMVLSQIEMRSSVAPAPLALRKNKDASGKQEQTVVRYAEGESESEEDEQMEAEVESGDEEGSLEDVELGRDSDLEEEESDEELDEEYEDEEDDDDDDSPTMNGFIDDEAEEYSEEEEEDDSE